MFPPLVPRCAYRAEQYSLIGVKRRKLILCEPGAFFEDGTALQPSFVVLMDPIGYIYKMTLKFLPKRPRRRLRLVASLRDR